MICQYDTLIIDLCSVVSTLEEKGEKRENILKNFSSFASKINGKYRLILLSNEGHQSIDDMLSQSNANEFFQKIISAEDVSHKKPSLEIFDATLEIIERKPSQCIFIDTQVKNLLFAEEVGISALLFNTDGENFDGMSVCSFNELLDIIG